MATALPLDKVFEWTQTRRVREAPDTSRTANPDQDDSGDGSTLRIDGNSAPRYACRQSHPLTLPITAARQKRALVLLYIAVAGADGHFELVLAHPTASVPGEATCEAVAPYGVTLRRPADAAEVKAGRVAVSAGQVRSGALIDLGTKWEDWED